MIKSMTAFSSVERQRDSMNVQMEIRSYNSRHLDLNVRMTYGYMAVEEKLRALIAEHIVRGRVEIKVGIRDEADTGNAFEVDGAKARAYFNALAELKDQLGTTAEVPLELVVTKGDVIRPLEQASAQATPLENPDYDAAKNEQAFIEGRILQLEQILKTAVIIEGPATGDVVGLGSKVTVTEGDDGPPERYTIVGSVEADPGSGFISNMSPLGRALIGSKAGDRVTVEAPDGEIEFCIQSID